MIKAIIFDCFGVLYVHRGREFTNTHVPAELMQEVRDLDTRSNLGMLDQADYEKAIAELTQMPVQQVHDGLISGFGRNEHLVAYIQQLRKTHKVGLLSNIGKNDMVNYFSDTELAQFFDSVVLSSDIGKMKPNAEAFYAACDSLGVQPQEAVMVDDNADNVTGAELAGLLAVRYEGYAHTIEHLNALLSKK